MIVIISNYFVPVSNADFNDERVTLPTRDNIQYLSFTTTATAASSGTKYRTLGWQIAFNVSGSTYKMIYPMNDGGQTGNITREIPFRGDNGAILETLCRAYGSGGTITNPDSDDVKIMNYMFTGGTVHINAVQTIVRDGTYDYAYANTNNGALNLNGAGELQGSQTGLYSTYSSIAGAVNWSGTALADLQGYYNIPKDFSAEQVPHYIHYIYSEYTEGQTIYDATTFKTSEDVAIAGINTKRTLIADDYTNSTRTFKSLKVSYDDNINNAFINISSRSINDFDFGATGKYNPNIYITSFYEVKKPTNPTAVLGVRDTAGTTVYIDDGHQFYTTGTNMNVTLVDKSFYDNLEINDIKIKDIKTGGVVFTGTITNAEHNLGNKPIGTYQYQMDITLENGNKISDALSFEILKGEETEEESILKVNSDIDAPTSVLEVYSTADATFTFRASSNFLLNGWRVIDGEEYVVGATSGDLEGYSDIEKLTLKIPVGRDVKVQVRVWDDSGERAYAEDITNVGKKEIKPIAGMKIRMLKEKPDKYTSLEYKQYKKIKIDTSYSDILTDDDVILYAPNNYNSSLTAVEIQPVTSSGVLDITRLHSIKFADESKIIREEDKITIRGDVARTEIHYLRFDVGGYYRLRNKVANDYKVSDWSSFYTINVLPENSPVVNSFEIMGMEKDLNGNYHNTGKFYNEEVNMWNIYRNSDDLVARLKIRANYTSTDDEIGDVRLLVSYDENGDLNTANDGACSNMVISKDVNNLVKISDEDVFRIISKTVGQNATEIMIEVSNDSRNMFGKLHFEFEVLESPTYPNYVEGELIPVPISAANILDMNNLNKNIYINNITPNLSVETEKDSKIDLYLQRESDMSYYSSIEPSLISVYKTKLNKVEFDKDKVLPHIISKDTNVWEEYSSSPYGCTVGNTSGNYQMGGMYAQKDGWIYYVSGSSIRKFKLGTWDEDTLLFSLPVSGNGQISLVNGYFYFDFGDSIWKIKDNGTGGQCLLSLDKSYYLNSLTNFVVRDEYIYFKRTYKQNRSGSKKYEIVRINVNTPVLNLASTDGINSTTIKGGSYKYEYLTLYDNYLLYTRDDYVYRYNLSLGSDSDLVGVSSENPIGYNGYIFFYRVLSSSDNIYKILATATNRKYSLVERDDGHIYNYNFANNFMYYIKTSTDNNPLGKTMLYKLDTNNNTEVVIDDEVSSGSTLYSMGGYVSYAGKKTPAWDEPVINLTPQNNKYGDNTSFSIEGKVTGEGTVWVRCRIGGKLVKQTFNNPSNETFRLNFNTKDYIEGIYKDIIVTATTSNGVYGKAIVGDITIRKALTNLRENVTGMPIAGNNGTRIVYLDSDVKIDDNSDNQTLINEIKLLATDRKLGIYASDINNQVIKLLVSNFSGITIGDNYNLTTDNYSQATNKIINYIDVKKSANNTAYFAIGRDELKFVKTFFDEDKDYRLSDSYSMIGKTTKTNDMLPERIKTEKDNTLKITFQHDPSVWHNPVSVHSTANTGIYDIVASKYDTTTNKHIIINSEGTEYLIGGLNDSMRGRWKAKLQAYDDTGKPLFDKIDTTEVSLYIHKPPVPKFSVTEMPTNLTLNDNGSYDIDMQYAQNNGIAKYKWRYLVRSIGGQETWIDAGEGEELKAINIVKAGRNIIDYELTVWDLQGCSTSISKNYLLLDAPSVDFDFVVNKNVTNYMYKGNVGSEKVSVKTNIKWNDDAYNSLLYNSSGTRTIQITNNKEQRTNEGDFNLEVLTKPIIELEKDKKITVSTVATNKYDITSIREKTANVKEIYVINNTNSFASYDTERGKGFRLGTTIPITVNVASHDGVDSYNDFIVKVTSSDLCLSNVQLSHQANGVYIGNFTLSKDITNKVEYVVNVYSARMGDLLNQTNGTSYIYVPTAEDELCLSSFRVVELKDTKLASYFIDPVNNEPKEVDMGVNLMAIDSTNFGGIPVTKGYKLIFKINSNNLNGGNDRIRIKPRFYTISGNVRDALERDVYWINSEHQIYKAGENAHSKYLEIVLDNTNRVVVNEKESIWQGEYLLPATAFAVPKGYVPKNINDSNLQKDIIVAFGIVAEKETMETYNYNTGNWETERTTPKMPYEIGDVIRYNYTTNGALDDVGVYRVR